MNLIGLRSAQVGRRCTLDKINRSLQKQAREHELTLKFLQTHRSDAAITFLQRNRNRADGLIIAPVAWARYELALLETLRLIRLPVVQVLFPTEFDLGPATGESLYTDFCTDTVIGPPETVFNAALTVLHNRLCAVE